MLIALILECIFWQIYLIIGKMTIRNLTDSHGYKMFSVMKILTHRSAPNVFYIANESIKKDWGQV